MPRWQRGIAGVLLAGGVALSGASWVEGGPDRCETHVTVTHAKEGTAPLTVTSMVEQRTCTEDGAVPTPAVVLLVLGGLLLLPALVESLPPFDVDIMGNRLSFKRRWATSKAKAIVQVAGSQVAQDKAAAALPRVPVPPESTRPSGGGRTRRPS